MALHATNRGVLSFEECTLPRVSERCHLERPRRMAGLAGSPQLGAMDVVVTRLTISSETAKVRDASGGRDAHANRHAFVARHTCEGSVLLRQRKSRRKVIEFAFFESRLRMTRGAVLLELATMRIGVAAGARTELERDLRRWLRVALDAVDRRMTPSQRKSRPRVIQTRGLPSLRHVTGRTRRAKRSLMRTRVAIAARRKCDALVAGAAMTRCALHPCMRTGQGKCRTGVIEATARLREAHGRGMAAFTSGSEGALVHVVVTRRTRNASMEKRTGFVTRAAVTRDWRVQPVQSESRLSRVIEPLLVERPKLSIGARMFHMTCDAVGGHLTVHTTLLRHALSDRPVTREAFVCGNALSRGVALEAVADAFEGSVCAAQAARRDQRPNLGRSDARREGTQEHASHHKHSPAPGIQDAIHRQASEE